MISHFFRKRSGLSYKSRTSLSKGIIKSFKVARFTRFFADGSMLEPRDDFKIGGKFILVKDGFFLSLLVILLANILPIPCLFFLHALLGLVL